MLMRDLPLEVAVPAPRRARDLACVVLRAASRALDGLAERLLAVEAPDSADLVFEYHADAAAPEGALYVNGRLVGHVLGVTRL